MNNNILIDPVQATISHCLNNYAYDDAIFLAERLHSLPLEKDDPEETQQSRLHTLATCYYRSNDKLQAFELLSSAYKSTNNLNYKNRYLLALVAYEMGRTTTSETTLAPPLATKSPLDYIEKSYCELSCFALKLYAKICMTTERLTVARECYSRALRLNPFLFGAFESCCKLGDKSLEWVGGVFQTGHLSEKEIICNVLGTTMIEEAEKKSTSGVLMNRNNTRNNRCHRNLFASTPNQAFGFTTPPTSTSTPSSQQGQLQAPQQQNVQPPQQPPQLSPITIQEEPKPKKTQNSVVRRSSRLFAENKNENEKKELKENTKESTTNSHKKLRKFDKSSLDALLGNMVEIGMATYFLSRYECRKALDILLSLRPWIQESGYVLATVARCYFELGEYEKAVGTYTHLSRTHPHAPSLTYLSSCYWHLSMETSLSSLSQQFLSSPLLKSSPTTWITLGNCFSLQKEHETAIKFFKRAIQTDPGNAYAYVLLGHEYVATDELDKALSCFRNGSRIDPGMYNCWYGIGMIYYKQERHPEAELYYSRAVSVNGSSVVLLCHLGVVQSSLNTPEKSLATFSRALKLNPHDPLVKFHRASCLFQMSRLDDALEELEELKRIVPKESLVHFLIAKIHSKKGDTHKALLHFSWATDLDPKGANNHIKESIEPVLSNID